MNKEQYKNHLKQLLNDDPYMATGTGDTELIYIIDEIKVYGGFEYGSRGIDHWSLFCEGMTWEEVIEYGVIAVPETKSYISNTNVELFENIGYTKIPIDNNHFIGWGN